MINQIILTYFFIYLFLFITLVIQVTCSLYFFLSISITFLLSLFFFYIYITLFISLVLCISFFLSSPSRCLLAAHTFNYTVDLLPCGTEGSPKTIVAVFTRIDLEEPKIDCPSGIEYPAVSLSPHLETHFLILKHFFAS